MLTASTSVADPKKIRMLSGAGRDLQIAAGVLAGACFGETPCHQSSIAPRIRLAFARTGQPPPFVFLRSPAESYAI